MNHFKQVMLAFHNFHDLNNTFPPSAIFGPDGKPTLSWRVALLPFLDQRELFDAFHLDEPWDSPHNKALIAKMPEIFTTPDSPAAPGKTRIRVFEGPGTMFNGDKAIPVAGVTDGVSNTVAIVTAAEAVPWTKPGDLPFVQGKLLPALDASNEEGVLVGMADGSARYAPRDDEALWKSLITATGGEVIQWPGKEQLLLQQSTTNAQVVPLPGGGIAVKSVKGVRMMPPIDEQRLHLLETKLDEILRRLDALEKTAREK